jgi:glycosyltransferase involved in cell wall biosynthesis
LLDRIERDFPNQVRRLWLGSKDIPTTLAAGDYGLLLREPSVTNQVAAPVKFAEYLACGLPVICSDCIGDYPNFIREHNAGIVINEGEITCPFLPRVPVAEKTRIQKLADVHFSKSSDSVRDRYLQVVEYIASALT